MPESWLGECLAGQERYAEAEPLLLDAYPRIEGSLTDSLSAKRACLESIIKLYEGWGNADKAAEWRDQLPPVGADDAGESVSDEG